MPPLPSGIQYPERTSMLRSHPRSTSRGVLSKIHAAPPLRSRPEALVTQRLVSGRVRHGYTARQTLRRAPEAVARLVLHFPQVTAAAPALLSRTQACWIGVVSATAPRELSGTSQARRRALSRAAGLPGPALRARRVERSSPADGAERASHRHAPHHYGAGRARRRRACRRARETEPAGASPGALRASAGATRRKGLRSRSPGDSRSRRTGTPSR